jgi:hypothetical protein
MAGGHHHIEGAAGADTLAIDGAVVPDVGLLEGTAVDRDLPAGIGHHPLTGQRDHPLDVGIAGWLLDPGQGADQGKVDQQAAEWTHPVLGDQGGIEVVGGVKDHNLPAPWRAATRPRPSSRW